MLLNDIILINKKIKETIEILFSVQDTVSDPEAGVNKFMKMIKDSTDIALESLIKLKEVIDEVETCSCESELLWHITNLTSESEKH